MERNPVLENQEAVTPLRLERKLWSDPVGRYSCPLCVCKGVCKALGGEILTHRVLGNHQEVVFYKGRMT